MKKEINLLNTSHSLYDIYLASPNKTQAIYYFCAKRPDNGQFYFIKNPTKLYNEDEIVFGKPEKFAKDPFFAWVMGKYGTSTPSLSQLSAIENTYINIQKTRNTIKEKNQQEGMNI